MIYRRLVLRFLSLRYSYDDDDDDDDDDDLDEYKYDYDGNDGDVGDDDDFDDDNDDDKMIIEWQQPSVIIFLYLLVYGHVKLHPTVEPSLITL